MNRFVIILAVVAAGCCGARQSSKPSELDAPSQRVLQEAGFDLDKIRCNSHVHWGPNLGEYADSAADKIAVAWEVEIDTSRRKKASRVVLSYLVRVMFQMLKPNNLGVVPLEGKSYAHAGQTHPVLLFRTGLMTDAQDPDSCMQSLFGEARVKHVVNLYAGTFPLHDFIATEERVAKENGASYHNEARINRPWRDLIEAEEDYEKNRNSAMQAVADLINTHILRPGGKQPQGNILIHCAGGMHRTGMIYGIIRRCINHDSMEDIESGYKRHTAYRSADQPAGYEELNMKFVREFDCNLLIPEPRGADSSPRRSGS